MLLCPVYVCEYYGTWTTPLLYLFLVESGWGLSTEAQVGCLYTNCPTAADSWQERSAGHGRQAPTIESDHFLACFYVSKVLFPLVLSQVCSSWLLYEDAVGISVLTSAAGGWHSNVLCYSSYSWTPPLRLVTGAQYSVQQFFSVVFWYSQFAYITPLVVVPVVRNSGLLFVFSVFFFLFTVLEVSLGVSSRAEILPQLYPIC